MNAPRPIFPIVIKLAAGLAVVALSGCAGLPFGDNKVDPTSPVAAEVAKLTRQDGKFPKFSSIPNPPTNLRPAPQYGRDARQVSLAAAALTPPGRTRDCAGVIRSEAQKSAKPAWLTPTRSLSKPKISSQISRKGP